MCSFLHVETFMNCRCCSGKEYIIHAFYVCFAGSVLLRLILTICIFTNRAVRRGIRESSGGGVGPLLGVTQDCSV